MSDDYLIILITPSFSTKDINKFSEGIRLNAVFPVSASHVNIPYHVLVAA